MSKIEELIEKLCPDGVEYKTLGEVLNYGQPSLFIVESSDYNGDINDTPVLTAGKSVLLGYTKETSGIYYASKNNPVIIFDDFTTSFQWIDYNFKVKSSAMKILKPNIDQSVSFRYIYHCMKNINFSTMEHSRQWISNYSKLEIPIPPLEIQEKIVEILDNFSSLTAELQAELQARKSQYEFYRNQLLTFDREDAATSSLQSDVALSSLNVKDNVKQQNSQGNFNTPTTIHEPQKVTWMKLGEIGEICMCKRIMKNQTLSKGDIPFYKIGTFGKEADAFITKELFNEYKSKYSFPKKGEILISASGTIGREVIYDGMPAYFQDSNIVWISNDESKIYNCYLYYLLQTIKWTTEGGALQRLYNDNIKKVEIPIPPLSEQERIVAILDKFDALVNDISIGLPAEIEARQKQYEYYRDALLNFTHKVN